MAIFSAHTGTVREAVGVFDDLAKLNAAVAELESTAFNRKDISVLGSRKEMITEFSQPTVTPQAVEDNPDTPRTVLVRPEETTIGTAALIGCAIYLGTMAAALGLYGAGMPVFIAGVASGGVVAGVIAAALLKAFNDRFRLNRERQIAAGGLVLWVATPAPDKEILACDILRRHGGRDIHLHDIN